MPDEPRLETAFDFIRLTPGLFEIGPFEVTAALMNHPVETYGFRVSYGGRSVAYSGDTGESAELVKLATGADVLLCEASFLDKPDLPQDLHLNGRQAAEHAARADVGTAGADPSRALERLRSNPGGRLPRRVRGTDGAGTEWGHV